MIKKKTKKVQQEKQSKSLKLKRLFYDIETSFNIVASWNIGYELNISHDSIIKERGIICICYKWADEDKVHHLTWKRGDDKKMINDFIKVLNSADEIIGHNADAFDLKWIRTRALKHGINVFPTYNSVDTLKLARRQFRLNSNKLDYIGQFLGVGKKLETGGFDLWKSIILDNDSKSMDKMVEYCKQDVLLLEKVFNKLNQYVNSKTHVGVLMGGDKCSCPECGSTKYTVSKRRITAAGLKKVQLQCRNCGKYQTLSESSLNK